MNILDQFAAQMLKTEKLRHQNCLLSYHQSFHFKVFRQTVMATERRRQLRETFGHNLSVEKATKNNKSGPLSSPDTSLQAFFNDYQSYPCLFGCW